MSTKSENYRRAGVDIDAADAMIERIKPLAARTRIPGAAAGIGGFGGVFDLQAAGFPGSPRLVAGTDGVGTKLRLAFLTGRHDSIGIDCVAMCVNDILAVGATPLFFLDYFATGRLDPAVGAAVIGGVVEGCRQARCWLMGGETAEMPGMYPDGEYDLAGFVVGAVRPEDELTPDRVQAGDVVVGIASSGLHSNGFSLARRVFDSDAPGALDTSLPGHNGTLGDVLLTPTRIYVDAVTALRAKGVRFAGVAHITGGGLWENPHRSLPDNLCVALDARALDGFVTPLFRSLSTLGQIAAAEMYRVFNMGIGMTLCVRRDDVDQALATLAAAGETAAVVGEVVPREEARVTIAGLATGPLSF